MEKMVFNVFVNATPEKVWDILWNDSTYREWTAVFAEGSHAVTTWEEGTKALFLSESGEGMVSVIAANKPYELMSIEHKGMVKDGVEYTDSEEVQEWSGAMENYLLKAVNGGTELSIEMDTLEKHRGYFQETWPKALEKVKELSLHPRVV